MSASIVEQKTNAPTIMLIVTILISAIQLALSIGTILNLSNSWIYDDHQIYVAPLLFPLQALLSPLFFICPLGISIGIFGLFRKRLAWAPFFSSIITASIVSIVFFARIVILSTADISYAPIIFIIITSAFIVGISGLVSTLAFRWLIPLELENEKINKISYSVDKPYAEIKDIVKDGFLELIDFKKVIQKNDMLIYHLKKTLLGFGITLVVAPNPLDEKKTIVATVAFRETMNSITSSKYAENGRESIINDLEKRVGLPFSTIPTTDTISQKAYNYAIAPAKPKLGWFINLGIPRFFYWLMAVTIIAMLLVNGMYLSGAFPSFDFNTNLSLTVGLFIAIIVEIGIPLYDRIRPRLT